MTEPSGFKTWMHEAWESGLTVGVLCALLLMVLFGFTLFFLAFPLTILLPLTLGYRYARPVKYSGKAAAVFSGLRSGIKPVIPTAAMLLGGSILIFLAMTGDRYAGLALLLGVPWTGLVIAAGAFGGLLRSLALPPDQTAPAPPNAPPPPAGTAK